MGPLIPLVALAAAALAMGSSKGSGAGSVVPVPGPSGVTPAASGFIATHQNPADLYAAAQQAYKAGNTADAAALLDAANTQRAATGLPSLPYPPVSDLGQPAATSPTIPGKPVAPPFVFSPSLLGALPGGIAPTPAGLGQSHTPVLSLLPSADLLSSVSTVAVEALKHKADEYIRESASLGNLDSTIAVASARIVAALIDGGDAAFKEAMSATMGAVAAGICSVTPAAPLAPICGMVGAWIGGVMGTGLGLKGQQVPDLLATHNDRFYRLYNALAAKVPDDRATSKPASDSIYTKATAQIAVICHLYVDHVSWGPVDPYGDTLDWGGGYAWHMVHYGEPTDLAKAGWSMLTNQLTEWKWVTDNFPAAFAHPGEPLPEFREGYCAAPAFNIPGCVPPSAGDTQKLQALRECRDARRLFWRFDNQGDYSLFRYVTEQESPAWKAFVVAVSRVFVASKAEAEKRFAQKVIALGDTIASLTLTECSWNADCRTVVRNKATDIAFKSLAVARGLPVAFGTPEQIIANGVTELAAEARRLAGAPLKASQTFK